MGEGLRTAADERHDDQYPPDFIEDQQRKSNPAHLLQDLHGLGATFAYPQPGDHPNGR